MIDRTAALRFAFALLAFLPAIAFAQASPRVATLAIEIWPEYDRPDALVILRGVLAEDVKLPAAVTLRIPSTTNGPVEVAYATSADGNLLNLKYGQAKSGDHVALSFELPTRFFHVEFYQPMTSVEGARTFRYTWPGDFAVARATLTVQEPAAAQGIATEPELRQLSTGEGGLTYRSGELGSLAAGKAVPILVKYTKSDTRPSAEIKGLRTAQAMPQSAPPAAAAMGDTSLPAWVLPMAAFGTLAIVGALLVLFLWRRESTPAPSAYCTKCGAVLSAGSNFCGKCGAKVGR